MFLFHKTPEGDYLRNGFNWTVSKNEQYGLCSHQLLFYWAIKRYRLKVKAGVYRSRIGTNLAGSMRILRAGPDADIYGAVIHDIWGCRFGKFIEKKVP